MPNHTDVRAMFYGDAEQVEKLRQAMRLNDLTNENELKFALSDEASQGFRFKSNDPFLISCLVPPSKKGIFGFLPNIYGASFSFTVATPMADSLLIPFCPGSEKAEEVLSGNWRVIRGADWEDISKAKSREEAIEILKKTYPDEYKDGLRRVSNREKYGFTSWYEWSIHNWGTKWDAYDVSWQMPKHSGQSVVVKMLTAWSAPIPALEDLCKKFDLSCACFAVDEGGGFSYVADITQEGHQADYDVHGTKKLESVQSSLFKKWKLEQNKKPNALELKKNKIKIKRSKLKSWPSMLARAEDLDEGSFHGLVPQAHSPEAVDAILAALGEKSMLSEAQALKSLQLLKSKDIISGSDLSSTGVSLSEIFALNLWTRGVLWAIGEDFQNDTAVKTIKILRHMSLQLNDKESFELALSLDPSWELKDLDQCPYACQLVYIDKINDSAKIKKLTELHDQIELLKSRTYFNEAIQSAINLLPEIRAKKEKLEIESLSMFVENVNTKQQRPKVL